MGPDEFRRIALGMADAVEREHMGHPDFRAPGPNGRIFATIHHNHESGSLLLTPEQQRRFLDEAPDAFYPVAGAWGRGGATSIRFEAADEETLGEAVTLAWQNAMNKVAKKPVTKPVKKQKPKGRK